jgi:DNA-binding MarR family transcriptional regulator
LEELGLVARSPDPEDGRAACLTLTKKSRKAFQQVREQMFERVQRFLSHLTDEEQRNLFNLMEKAVNGLELTAKQAK